MLRLHRVQAVEAHVHFCQRAQNGESFQRRKSVAAQVKLLKRSQLLNIFNCRYVIVRQRKSLELHAAGELREKWRLVPRAGVRTCGRRVTMSLTSSTLNARGE